MRTIAERIRLEVLEWGCIGAPSQWKGGIMRTRIGKLVCATVLLLTASAGTGWGECPKWTDPLKAAPNAKAGNDVAGALAFFSSSTTVIASSATVTGAHASGTSGCPKHAQLEREAHQFIAASGTHLLHQMSQGQGERLTGLATLLGCDATALAVFGELTQARFEELVPGVAPQPQALLMRLKQALRADERTAGRCSEV